MEKDKTLYKKIEDNVYACFSYGANAIIILGGIGIMVGLLAGEKKLFDSMYDLSIIGVVWKGGALLSERQYKPVSGLEDKIEE